MYLNSVHEHEYDAIYPKRMQGAVELYLVNGEMKKYQIEEARYYDYTDIDEGFDYYLSKAFDTNRVARIKDMIDNIESLNSISELAAISNLTKVTNTKTCCFIVQVRRPIGLS